MELSNKCYFLLESTIIKNTELINLVTNGVDNQGNNSKNNHKKSHKKGAKSKLASMPGLQNKLILKKERNKVTKTRTRLGSRSKKDLKGDEEYNGDNTITDLTNNNAMNNRNKGTKGIAIRLSNKENKEKIRRISKF